MLKNCINCGAPLHGRKCDYCGTEYSDDGGICAIFGDNDMTGEVIIGEKRYHCYLSCVDIQYVGGEAARSIDGTLHRYPGRQRHTFTLVEF